MLFPFVCALGGTGLGYYALLFPRNEFVIVFDLIYIYIYIYIYNSYL